LPTYFDAVLQNGLHPLFNGTTEETVEFLQTTFQDIIELKCNCVFSVIEGSSMRSLTVPEYLTKYAKHPEA
jgi:hypothetical protein